MPPPASPSTRSSPRLSSYRVDAIFIARAILSSEAADEFARYEIPIISFNTLMKNRWVSSVCCDHRAGAQSIAELFVERGATRCAYISSSVAALGNTERMEGFTQRLRELGLADPIVVETEFRYEGGHAAALRLFESGARPDAIFCFNDLVAIGAIDAIRKTVGLRVPEDVQVAGYDDIPAAAWAAYDLTTLAQDSPSMVEASLAIFRSATTSASPLGGVRTTVPVRLVERGTTRPRAAPGLIPAWRRRARGAPPAGPRPRGRRGRRRAARR
ncbi:MAG: substrate-binding domain-containing protein [Geminicoccaceae bacterium]